MHDHSTPFEEAELVAAVPAWRLRVRRAAEAARDESGAATAEYAMVVLAAVGLGGLLALILKSDEVRSMLTELISRALTAA